MGLQPSHPTAPLTIDPLGNFYGTASGGANDEGEVFKLSGTNHSILTDVVSFPAGLSGFSGNPISELTLGSDGTFYGTTLYGGTQFLGGTIFQISGPSYATFTSLYYFDDVAGSHPGWAPNGLTIDLAGNLYGTTSRGGLYDDGLAFSLNRGNPGSSTTLVTFNSNGNAFSPSGDLAADANGNLFGTTERGGAYGYGSVFELSGPSHSTYSTLVSFTGESGAYPGSQPLGGVSLDSAGNIYGTTSQGGTDVAGTVWEISGANHAVFRSLHSFVSYDPGGESPASKLAIDAAGNLYGTTSKIDDSFNGYDGTVFELSGPNRSIFTTLYTFGDQYNSGEISSLTLDSSGNLFGTNADGNYASGTVFELTGVDHKTYKELVDFDDVPGSYPGEHPNSSLVIDGNGNLYGTTDLGGQNGDGTLFELSGSDRSVFLTIAQFNASIGNPFVPNRDLAIDSLGNVYGVAAVANMPDVIFKLSGATGTYQIFQSISGNDQSLICDESGNLFGNCQTGGAYGQGYIFEIAKSGIKDLLENSGSVTLAAPGGDASTEAFNSISIGASADVGTSTAPSGHTLLVVNTLTIAGSSNAWTGRLDLANNDLDLATGAFASVTSQIRQGYSLGNWLGFGITSSAAAIDSTHLTALGVVQNNQSGSALFTATNPLDGTTPGAGDILVKYTYYGDANLDGKVDGSDYSLIDNGYLTHATGWYNGDFNYNGIVDGSDYTLIDNAFNTQGASLAAIVGPAARAAGIVDSVARPSAVFSDSRVNAPLSGWATVPAGLVAEVFASDAGDSPLAWKFLQRREILGTCFS